MTNADIIFVTIWAAAFGQVAVGCKKKLLLTALLFAVGSLYVWLHYKGWVA